MPWLEGRVSRVSLLPLREGGSVTGVISAPDLSAWTHITENQLGLNGNSIFAVGSVWPGAALLHSKHGGAHVLHL